jgi:hypothetical protein
MEGPCAIGNTEREQKHLTFFYLFYYSYVHTRLGSFLLPYQPPRPLPLRPPSIPSRNYFALISNFVEKSISNNRKEQGFLLVEIRIAIQGVDSH